MTIGGRVNAERLAQELGVPMDGVARILGSSERFLRRYPEAPSIQSRALRLIERLRALAEEVGSLELVAAWLRTPADELGGISTVSVLENRFDVGLAFVDQWLAMTPD